MGKIKKREIISFIDKELYDNMPEFQLITKTVRLKKLQEVIENTIEFVKKSLEEGKTIEIRGFGVFKKVKRKGKKGRKVKTGEIVNFSDYFDVKFKTSKQFKQEINKKR